MNHRRNINYIVIVFVIFLFVGIGEIVGGILFNVANQKFRATAQTTQGVITQINTYHDSDGDMRHEVYVKYTVNGVTYNNSLSYYSSSMAEGKSVTLYYNPEDLNQIKVRGSNAVITIVLASSGGVFVLVGLGGIIPFVMSAKKKKRLQQEGIRVSAKIVDVILNTQVRVNGRNPYVIHCKWVDDRSGNTYFFKSKNLYYDPCIDLSDGNQWIEVLLDPNDYSKYYVVTDDLGNKIYDFR
jgi:hypothetical protein